MQTIKTGVVVALLIAVCYGAFIALNTPDPQLPPELQEWAEFGGADSGQLVEFEVPGSGLSPASPESVLDALTGAAPSFADSSSENLPSASGEALALPTFDQLPSQGMAANEPNFPSPGGLPLLDPTDSSADASLPNLPPQGNAIADATPGNPLPAIPPLTTAADSSQSATPELPSMSLGGVPVSPAVDSSQQRVIGQNVSTSRELPNGNLLGSSEADLPPFPADDSASPGSVGLAEGVSLPFGDGSSGAAIAEEPVKASTIPEFSVAREEWLRRATVNGELRAALEALTRYYNSPELTNVQHSDLVNILDGLAREVIYSRRHLMLPSHPSTSSETVDSIAKSYSINPELLAKVNGLGDSKAIVPGTTLKVIPGPFSAEVSLSRRELTLFVKGMYAGRFGVSLGNDPFPPEGKFEVGARQRDRTYFGAGSRVIAGTDSLNPYGGFWLNLGRDICIHGSPEKISPDLEGVGCISLAPLDASDVYDILTVGSQVSIIK